MEQVLTNLLTNAIKYSGETKKIAIKAIRVGAYIKVAVKDLGIGISKEKLPYVFELFYRTHDFSPLISGLGLGLFISSEIVKRHGGEIGAESEPGKGSTFWFTLPLYKPK